MRGMTRAAFMRTPDLVAHPAKMAEVVVAAKKARRVNLKSFMMLSLRYEMLKKTHAQNAYVAPEERAKHTHDSLQQLCANTCEGIKQRQKPFTKDNYGCKMSFRS